MKHLFLLAVLLLASCSAGFNHEWQETLANGKGVTPRDLTGAWLGTWRSEANGHHGELRCIVSRTRASDDRDRANLHRFHYHATFMKAFSATYDVEHQVKKTTAGFSFFGDQKLSGLGGGLYHYEGKGTPAQFSATFRNASDHGVFELKRP